MFEAFDARAELLGALATLPPRQRAVLVLRYFEDLSEAETARTLNCSVGTVKSTASRGLTRLRQERNRASQLLSGSRFSPTRVGRSRS